MMSAAAEQVAGGFSSAVIQRSVDKTTDFLVSNYNLSHATEEFLTKLRTSLTMVKAITEVADNQLITSTSLTKWLRNLHDAAYEAEDVLDRFDCQDTVLGKRKMSELISSSIRALKSLIVPDEDMKMLESVVQKLDHLCATSNTFLELLKQSGSASIKEDGVGGETTSRVPVDVKVFGRDEVLEWILKIVLGSSGSEPESSSRTKLGSRYTISGVDVIPIVGMSGVGKTTLAQVIYNHEDVKGHFGHRAWVYVSKHFSVKRMLQEILCSFKGNGSSFDCTDSLETIVNNIQNVIRQEGRFLLVLDSVWDEICAHWNFLLTAIAREVPGSVVVVTTQSKRVADTVATMCPVPLAPLPCESFWLAFQYYAFGTTDVAEDNQTLLLIGEQIAKKLDGLPLAAKIMGNLLRSGFTVDRWRTILESDWWDLSEVLCEILPYMGISYQDLQPRQRQCFAFCSIFPGNYLFDKDRLVNMWISHNFIKQTESGGTRLEDIGGKLFDELVQRSFFQATFDKKRYTMHDLVRALAIGVSSYECFLHKETSCRAPPPTVRHLALKVSNQLHIHELNKYKNLRTILLFGICDSTQICGVVDSILTNSRSIRVLDLSYLEVLTNMPAHIPSLKKLRFFDLSFTRVNNLRNFPCNLHALYLHGYTRNSIPQSINTLANLRHLYVDATALSLIPGIGQLSQLQELENFSVGKRNGFLINELKNMQELSGKLCISNIHIIRSRSEATGANMIEKKHLEALELKGRNVSRDVLEGLQPHSNLQELVIEGYGATTLPSWIFQGHIFTKMQSLHVGNCRHLAVLPPFGKFPSLKHLTLDNLPSVKHVDGTHFSCLPSLEDLKVSSMTSWIEWSHAEEAHGPLLPHLIRFELHDCSLLEKVSSLSFMSSLSELNISACGNFVKALPQYVQLLANLKKLRISYCDHPLLFSGHQLKSLEYLYLRKCGGLRLIDGLHCFPSLRQVNVYGCPDILTEFSDNSRRQDVQGALHLTSLETDVSLINRNSFLPSVRALCFSYLEAFNFTSEQEEWFEQLISVEKIEFFHCRFLHGRLPSTLGRLISLKVLRFITTLPVSLEGLVPLNLQELIMDGFNMENNFKPGGSDWPNISHVPYIRLNGKTVQNLSIDAASSSSSHQI